ncbi:MAG: hypothetical protein O3B75_07360 [Planctomycetota bacterium]|nr:hypothetical protein [Planctomycetota bacterium]
MKNQTMASNKLNNFFIANVIACSIAATSTIAFAQAANPVQNPAQNNPGPALPALPVTPSINTVPTIISLQPVTIKDSYATDFRSEHPQVSSGWLMVIRGDSSILAPRALAEPLLLASGISAEGVVWIESVEWFNHGFISGYRVCFIPSTAEPQSGADRTTQGLRVWFGSPKLPESVDANTLQSELKEADRAGIVAASAVKVEGAAPKVLANRDELITAANALIARWAPDESQAEGASVPVAPASK